MAGMPKAVADRDPVSLAVGRATLREQSDRLAWLALELGRNPHEPVLVRCAGREG
jgi:hypothetical protein